MRDYLIKRILLAIGVIFAISAITFFVLNIVPGEPVRVMVGDMTRTGSPGTMLSPCASWWATWPTRPPFSASVSRWA